MLESPNLEWVAWFTQRLTELKMTTAQLARASGIPDATLRSYKSGQRKPTNEGRVQLLASNLTLADESAEDVEETIRRVCDNPTKPQSEGSILRTMTISYPPFADGKNFFVDQLFNRFFRLSVSQANPFRNNIGFAIRKRLEMLDSGACDIATNLLGTLHRLKQLRYYWFPVSISINAVSLRRYAKYTQTIAEFVAFGKAASDMRIWPIVVEMEVGAVHVQQTLGYEVDSQGTFADDLDARGLARLLREKDGEQGVIPCVITDEITALQVAKQLGDDALVVLPISTAESSQTSRVRLAMPVHFLGAAVSRKNRKLRDYMDDAWAAMLLWEQDSIVSDYCELFSRLTEYVADCLAGGPVLADVGRGILDLRRLTTQNPLLKELVVNRLAMAFAKRTLQLDRRSLAILQRNDSPWFGILERTRQEVLILEAEDRFSLRRRVVLMLEEALGKGFAKHLRRFSAVSDQSPGDDGSLIGPLLENEFDIDSPQVPTGQYPREFIEDLTTSIQKRMEINSLVALHTRVIEVPGSEDALQELKCELHEQYPNTEPSEMGRGCRAFVAIYRGEPVGCIEVLGAVHEPGARVVYQLRNLYVQRPVRKRGVGRLLIREALHHVIRTALYSASRQTGPVDAIAIDIDMSRVPEDANEPMEFFRHNGFQPDGESRILRYSLELLPSGETTAI